MVGAASRDLTDDPRGWRLGGAAAYVSLTLARLGLPVRALIGLDADASTAAELGWLRAAGVELEPVPLRSGPVFENIETPGGRVQRCHSSSDPMTPERIPPRWRRGGGSVVLAPVAAELPESWADVPAAGAVVGLGWQGLLRRLEAGSLVERVPPRPGPLLGRADIVVVSRDDLSPATKADDLARLVRDVATLVVTEGRMGGAGVVVRRVSKPRGGPAWERYSAVPADGEIDPTGAGDVFLATMLAARLDPSRLAIRRPDLAAELAVAAAAASLAVERPGLEGVPSLASVLGRLRRS